MADQKTTTDELPPILTLAAPFTNRLAKTHISFSLGSLLTVYDATGILSNRRKKPSVVLAPLPRHWSPDGAAKKKMGNWGYLGQQITKEDDAHLPSLGKGKEHQQQAESSKEPTGTLVAVTNSQEEYQRILVRKRRDQTDASPPEVAIKKTDQDEKTRRKRKEMKRSKSANNRKRPESAKEPLPTLTFKTTPAPLTISDEIKSISAAVAHEAPALESYEETEREPKEHHHKHRHHHRHHHRKQKTQDMTINGQPLLEKTESNSTPPDPSAVMQKRDRKYLLNRIETLFKAQSVLESMSPSLSNESPTVADNETNGTLNLQPTIGEEELGPITFLPKRGSQLPTYPPQKESGPPDFQATGVSIQLPVSEDVPEQKDVSISVTTQEKTSRRGSSQQPAATDKSRRGSIQQGVSVTVPGRKASIQQQEPTNIETSRRASIQQGHSRQPKTEENEPQVGSILQAMTSRRQSLSVSVNVPSRRSSILGPTNQPKLLSVVNTVRKKSTIKLGVPGGGSVACDSNSNVNNAEENPDSSTRMSVSTKESSLLPTPDAGSHRPSVLQTLKSKIRSKVMTATSEQSSLNSSTSIRDSRAGGDQWGGVLQQMRQNALVTKFKTNLESNAKGIPLMRRGSILEGSNFPVNGMLKNNGYKLSESGNGGSVKRAPSMRRGWSKLKGSAMKSFKQDDSEDLKEEVYEGDDLLDQKAEDVVLKVEHIHDSNRARLHWLLFLYAALRSNRIKLIKPSSPVKLRSIQSVGKQGSISVTATPTSRLAKTPLLLSSEEDAALAEMPFLAPSDKPTMTASIQMQELFKVPKGQRMEKELAQLEQCLGKTRFFSKYPPHLRAKLYNMCSYQTYAKGTRLIREGHLPDSCYVLILGECAQYTEAGLRQVVPTILSHTEQGFLIGDLANHVPGERRAFSVVCVMRTSLLSMSKTDWMQITREAKSYETYQFDIISSLPLLRDLPKLDISRLSSKGSIRKFPANSTILRVDDSPEEVYFIIKGKVKAYTRLVFMKSRDSALSRNYVIQSFSGQSINTQDEIVHEFEPVGDILKDQFFPPLQPLSSLTLLLQEATKRLLTDGLKDTHFQALIKKSASSARYRTAESGITFNPMTDIQTSPLQIGDPNPSLYSYVTQTPVECFCIPRKFLVDLLTPSPNCLEKLTTAAFFPNTDTLWMAQERYMVLHGWRGGADLNRISNRIELEFQRIHMNYALYRKLGDWVNRP